MKRHLGERALLTTKHTNNGSNGEKEGAASLVFSESDIEQRSFWVVTINAPLPQRLMIQATYILTYGYSRTRIHAAVNIVAAIYSTQHSGTHRLSSPRRALWVHVFKYRFTALIMACHDMQRSSHPPVGLQDAVSKMRLSKQMQVKCRTGRKGIIRGGENRE